MKQNRTSYKKYITDDELLLLDEYFDLQEPAFRACYRFMKYLGYRVSDAVSVKLENIQNDRIIITMRKTGRVLELPLPLKLQQWLFSYVHLFVNDIKRHNDYICFSPRNSGHINEGSVRALFVEFRRLYNLNNPYYTTSRNQHLYRITCHCLRHHALNIAYTQKGIMAATTLAGHTRPETTLRYYIDRTNMSDLKEIVNIIN